MSTLSPNDSKDDIGWKAVIDAAFIIARQLYDRDDADNRIMRYVAECSIRHTRATRYRPPTYRYMVPRAIELAVIERDGGKCMRCGSGALLTVDHITPVFAGGTNEMSNLQTLCKSCNESKGPRPAAEPCEDGPWYRKAEICECLGVTERTIDQMVRRGQVARRQGDPPAPAYFQPLFK